MSLSPPAEWLELAIDLARRGGEALRAAAATGAAGRAELKGARELVTEADRASERIVVGGLRDALPDHGICAEEGVFPASVAAEDAEWVWYVDPLDGTANFVHSIPFYAVAIGLVHRGVPVLGVVHAPLLGETYAARQGAGAQCNGAPIRVSETRDLGAAMLATGLAYRRDEPQQDDNVVRLARVLPRCRDVRRLGSAQLDLCLTACGRLDGYWELELAPYDVVAGAAIVREAGGRVTDLRGGEDWWRGYILASNGALHDALLVEVGG
ncbi:MAG: inositol monophosphatase family protein [Planctomycetota bacterium]